ncbi:MAG: type II secretion system F family protein [Planctomycetaceae bacterium]|nr:type II secretion system F family protein [Planctomycetales bacterium]MCB9927657.1 type II secretion system F family protein [Planctomycetaceae bacterium]
MSSREHNSVRSISLEQLIALNDEMAGLVRSGIPLESGLVRLGQDMPGRLGRLASFLGERTSAGESLDQILANNEDRFPPLWRAVVRAGLRSGRLSSALESMATTGRRVVEIRSAFGLAMVYPMIVVMLAFGSFVMLTTKLAPITLDAYEDLTVSSDPLLQWLVWLGSSARWWGIAVPVFVFVCVLLYWYRTSRAALPASITSKHRGALFKSLRDGRIAAFTEILALLIRQHVPLHEALELAGAASGDVQLAGSSKALAGRVERGEALKLDDDALIAFPPLLGWLIAVGGHPEQLAQTLAEMAQQYRERAERATNWLTLYLPIVITAAVGGSVVLLQALAVFRPICNLLFELGSPL